MSRLRLMPPTSMPGVAFHVTPAYPTREDLAEDVVRILRQEVSELHDAGADFAQFDEPVLTELVFT